MGQGISFGDVENVPKLIVVMVANSVNTLKATQSRLQVGKLYSM
jgi:hypothetical protein